MRQDKRPNIHDPSFLGQQPSVVVVGIEDHLVDSSPLAAEVGSHLAVGSHLVEGIRRHRIAEGTEDPGLVGSILGSTW